QQILQIPQWRFLREWLSRKDVQRGRANPSAAQGPLQCRFIDQRAATHIDETCVRTHLRKCLVVEKSLGGRHEWSGDDYVLSLREHLMEICRTEDAIRAMATMLGMFTHGDHLHGERLGQPHTLASNGAKPDDAKRGSR